MFTAQYVETAKSSHILRDQLLAMLSRYGSDDERGEKCNQ